MTISLVTDSTADVPADLVARYGICVVPTLLVAGGQTFRDGLDISRDDFYRRLPALSPLPTTAAPASGEFEAVYEALPPGPIISLHPPPSLSGIFNAARLGAEKFGDRVRVIDCGSISLGLGWQVVMAAEAVASGAALEAVLELVASLRRRVRVLALLDTVDNLRRGGRIGLLRASVGTVLQIKPLLDLTEGTLTTVSQERTRKRALAALLASVKKLGPLERLALLYTDNPAPAHDLRAQLAPLCRAEPWVAQVTPIIGTHVGANAVGIAAVLQ